MALRKKYNVRTLTVLSLFTAMAYILVLFKFSIMPTARFLEFEFKDVLITIGAFVYGPMAGALMSVVVSLIEMITVSDSGPIGLLMNILSTVSFSCVAAAVYQRKRSLAGGIAGLLLGCVSMTSVMILWNYFITPLYMNVPRETIAGMLIPVFLVFNLIKSVSVSAVVLLLYKPFMRVFGRFMRGENPAESGGKQTNYLLAAAALTVLAAAAFLIFLWNLKK